MLVKMQGKETPCALQSPPYTFGLGLDNELLAPLLQWIGGSAGVGPWLQ